MVDLSRKVVIVGDGMVGKTALLYAYVNGKFQEDYIPTVFETTAKEVDLPDGRQVTLGLWDTGGQEEFDQIRQLAYPGASLILLCYAVDCPTSLDNIIQTWVGEVRNYCPHIPLMLVGCKSDRRSVCCYCSSSSHALNQTGYSQPIKPEQAQWVCQQIGAQVHIECSAYSRANIETVFQLAARFILDMGTEKSRPISIRRMLSFTRDRSLNNGTAGSGLHNSQSHQQQKRIVSQRIHSPKRKPTFKGPFSCFSGKT
ncbi:Transforming protein RhoA [Fasciolopsis buskii]|uniref:Transforming protein RhoA n=1 Tax=Fasciolopsis buskii TaxID=27845 RepID=A0A8E0RUD2_9TREM|nr:Transforming protein RhoA [Fasciolopsis buski]